MSEYDEMADPFCPDFQLIPGSTPPVYIGSYPEPGFGDQVEWYQKSGPRVIVCLTPRVGYRIPDDAVLMQFPMRDVDAWQGLPDPDRLLGFIAAVRVMVDGFGPPLFHCHAGMNRSAYVAVRYLQLTQGMEPTAAIARVRQVRGPRALFNRTFEADLLGRQS